MIRTIFAFACLFACLTLSAKEQAGQASLCFVENRGQIMDQYGKARNDIDYKIATGQGLNVFIGKGGIHYQWNKEASPRPSPKERAVFRKEAANKNPGADKPDLYESPVLPLPGVVPALRVEMCRMDVELVGANTFAKVFVEEKQDYYETYYTAPFNPDHGCIVHSYKKLTYKDVYPDIDWVLYIKDNKMEYDFVVKPGGDVKSIQLRYHGADNMTETNAGVVKAMTMMGNISEQKPYSYERESGRAIASAFELRNHILSFNVEAYNGTLVIDPTLDWATYYGALGDEIGKGLTCDAQGNVYMTGYTSSVNNIATVGVYQTSLAGDSDAYVVQFNSAGQRMWATYYGGINYDGGEGIVYNGTGGLLVCGYTNSNSGIATNGTYQTTYGGSTDAFLAKFNTAGALLWATYFGGSASDQAIAVSCYGSNIYIAGQTQSNDSIATSGTHQDSLVGGQDAFLAKFNASGSLLWATYYGGGSIEFLEDVGVDLTGNPYICGNTTSTNGIATSGSYQNSYGGSTDAYLAKFDTSGSLSWGTYYGGNSFDGGGGIAFDSSGNVYFTGGSASTSGIATSGSYQSSLGGNWDAFLAKFNTSGSLQWATYYGGAGSERGTKLVYGKNGNVYFTGLTSSATNIATNGSYQTTYGGGTSDAFVAEFNSNGQRQWATYYGGNSTDEGYGIAIDPSDNLYISGRTYSANQIATTNAFQNITGGGYDAFLAKFKVDTLVVVGQPFIDTLFCAGDTFHLAYTTIDTFLGNNVFTAQLSDSSGSFANPVNIGIDTASYAGNIFCTIPVNTTGGTHYRIRIFANHPVDTSKDDGVNIVIKGIPFHSASYNAPQCVGDTLRLKDSANSVVSYHWSGPNGVNSTLQNPYLTNISLADSGRYYIMDSFQNGCKVRDTLDVVVGTIPAKPVASSNSPICAGDSLQFTVSNSQAGLSYIWSGPNGFSDSLQSLNIAHVLVIDSGKYMVRAVLNGCMSKADTIDVVINPLVTPTVSISSIPVVIVAGQSDTFTAVTNGCSSPVYQWYNNSVAINGATGSTYVITISNADNISVVVHCNGACLSTDTAVSNNLNTSAVSSPGLSKGEDVQIYPNPASTVLNVKADVPVNVVLSGIDGRVLFSQDNAKSIDISQLVRGLYLVSVYDSNMVLLKTVKLVKVL